MPDAPHSSSTPLEARLIRRIALTGPMSVSDYMAACIAEPTGYYAEREVFGARGDFVTAPEISQMFGELVGAWLLERWRTDGAPAPVDLVELGPGRGTLMADALRVLRRDEAFMAASRLVLVEASERLRTIQRERLGALHPRIVFGSVPSERPIYLIANEFLDALPIRQFVHRDGRWFERTVGLADGRLSLGLSPFPVAVKAEAEEGAVLEVRPAADALACNLGATLASRKVGAALFIDYGYEEAIGGETLQAVRRHAPAGVLDAPGEVDLSAHVDFGAFARAAEAAGATVFGPRMQGEFLLALGLLERAGQLGANEDASGRAMIQAAVERLAGTGPGEMGALFKVLALAGGTAPSPGFARR